MIPLTTHMQLWSSSPSSWNCDHDTPAHACTEQDDNTIEAFLAETTGKSSRKSFNFIIKNCIYRIKVSKKSLDLITAHHYLQMTREPLEESLFRFSGCPGGPHPPAWQLGPSPQPHSHHHARVPHDMPPFLQPVSVTTALLEVQMRLLGRMLTLVSETNQIIFLEIMIASISWPATPRGRKLEPQQVRPAQR